MVLTLNYFAMIVGYISLFFIALVLALFTYLYIKEKYSNWKWKKDIEKRKKEQEEKKAISGEQSLPAASQREDKQETAQEAHIPENEKAD
ncbi:hypothetical protein HYY71_02270 [Candidatus Woesearchaeota archaeon]|nr:hypothetical protein [Candidatus Woesearchaeota archaeon]